jgi:hypothetical protein
MKKCDPAGSERTMEDNMSALTLFVGRRSLSQKMLPVLIAMALTLSPLLASAGEDPCQETGIYIGNQTLLNLWYTRNGGECTIWAHHHILIIKPEDKLIVFKDNICKTEYCPDNPTYKVYKSLDANQNCRVRILPECTLSDM